VCVCVSHSLTLISFSELYDERGKFLKRVYQLIDFDDDRVATEADTDFVDSLPSFERHNATRNNDDDDDDVVDNSTDLLLTIDDSELDGWFGAVDALPSWLDIGVALRRGLLRFLSESNIAFPTTAFLMDSAFRLYLKAEDEAALTALQETLARREWTTSLPLFVLLSQQYRIFKLEPISSVITRAKKLDACDCRLIQQDSLTLFKLTNFKSKRLSNLVASSFSLPDWYFCCCYCCCLCCL
jgi:hypothetical protein